MNKIKLLTIVIILLINIGCGSSGGIKVPEDSTDMCKAYYSTLIIISKSNKSFLKNGVKDFGLVGVWANPCIESIKANTKLKADKFKLEKIMKCQKTYFKKAIVSKKDADIYFKYLECIK